MAFVVTEQCIACKYTDCVEVCPVDCFHQGEQMLVIDPDECIDCALCEGECPVNAIYCDDEVPEQQKQFIDFNKTKAKIWPKISQSTTSLPEADKWAKKPNKRKFIDLDD